MVVSTPESTAVDLVRFARSSGHWSNVATVVGELAESIDPKRLVSAVATARLPVSQRLGYILDVLHEERLAGPLAEWLAQRRTTVIPFRTDRSSRGAKVDARWRLVPNERLEPDL